MRYSPDLFGSERLDLHLQHTRGSHTTLIDPNQRHMRTFASTLLLAAVLAACAKSQPGGQTVETAASAGTVVPAACTGDNAGLTLPAGFCATVFADSLGSIRHIAIAPNGDVFLNARARRPAAAGAPAPAPQAPMVGLRDTNGDGKADVVERFGEGGGTGIALHNGFLYADVGTKIVRYPLAAGQLRPTGAAETVVEEMPLRPGHDARNFAIGRDNSLYVNFGSATNACQAKDRTPEIPGVDPCVELDTRAGIWKFSATSANQKPSLAARYATGIRNAVGLTINPADGKLYAMQHGRDQLGGPGGNWPKLFTEQQNSELPAEVLLQPNQGDDYGWPYCYYDGAQKKLVLAPEYGGDGTQVGRCSTKKGPLAAMPAHWAPNGLAFYSGSAFPAKYRGGAFIAFHGSWNRANQQQGFRVVFVPMKDGQATGSYEDFATGFDGGDPNKAAHRPTGIAVAPDGSMYISDDKAGRLYRVTYGAR
jgi:glucose/arabinose dehydrogenase